MAMDMKVFIQNFANAFNVTDVESLQPGTIFKELEEWSSMSLVLAIAIIDEKYGVTVDDDIIRQAETLEDLFNAVKALYDSKEQK